jgi:riboflavin kinase/FMN adenylyltransferase
MNVIYDLKELKRPLINPVLTIGNFDGVHKGHLSLFDRVKQLSDRIHGQSVVMTFDPHPIRVMKPGNGPPLITPTKQKLQLISDAGIDVILCIPFTREFASIPAEAFVRDILVGTIGIKEIVVGYDYTFGSERRGDTELLRKMGEELGFKVHVVEPIHINDILISSTSIRNFVQQGNLADTKKLLGRDYQITGTVKTGAGRGGKLLGIPTANLLPVDELIPKRGVYAVIAVLEDRNYFGVCNIGYNPTFGVHALSIETHLLDFHEDIVGRTITIRFISHLREEKSYRNAQDLADQIRKDIQQARELFGLHE